jgi:predicted nucleic acid-binding protein
MGVKGLYRLFIDTGAFIALVDERDPLHQETRTFYTSLTKRASLLTWIRFPLLHYKTESVAFCRKSVGTQD